MPITFSSSSGNLSFPDSIISRTAGYAQWAPAAPPIAYPRIMIQSLLGKFNSSEGPMHKKAMLVDNQPKIILVRFSRKSGVVKCMKKQLNE